MRVSDVMTQPVISVKPDALLSDVIALMIRNKFSGAPVVDENGELIGVISEGDLLRRIELGTSDQKHGFWAKLFSMTSDTEVYTRVNGRRVQDVMTASAVTVEANDTLAEAAQLLQKHKIKRLPVMADGKLVGVLTRGDFIKALGQFLAPAYEDTIVSDDEIIAKIREEIMRQDWSVNCAISIASSNGTVTLSGRAPSEAHRRAIIVAAETVSGVRAVNDDIEGYEPILMVGM